MGRTEPRDIWEHDAGENVLTGRTGSDKKMEKCVHEQESRTAFNALKTVLAWPNKSVERAGHVVRIERWNVTRNFFTRNAWRKEATLQNKT